MHLKRFIESFALYLRVERKMQPETANGRIALLQKVIKVAHIVD
jgi:hypothetical protein